ncbi:MAG: 3-phosphoshikimate 1-carboxyvinyltransferase [Clostridiales bacterium]|nr:3-phosphoshikimate 1-carboxyvinyltransferase [Candidatus Equinaster intestinalis]
MIAKIGKGKPHGIVVAPPSKSMAHRLLICAALSGKNSTVKGVSLSNDILATLNCIKASGLNFENNNGTVCFNGDMNSEEITADCKESGSTLRFFIPIFWALGKNATLYGSEYLFTRPLSVYEELAKSNGLILEKSKDKVYISGKLSGGEFTVRGDISSQFISGLLFALPLCENDSVIKILPPLESKPYIDMTVSALNSFGIDVFWQDNLTLYIKGNQKYKPAEITVEGDYSNAAFFAALKAFGGDIEINGLSENSLQGDRVVFGLLQNLMNENSIIDVSDCPDIAPILITAATYLHGGKFIGTNRLKIKESDRGRVIAEELAKFGADIKVSDNEISVTKTELHKPGEILCSHNDHRIVMSLAVLLTEFSGEIENCEAVNKSFPDFFEKLKSLGIEVDLYENN